MKRLLYILFAVPVLLSGCIKDETVKNFKDVELPVINNPEKDPDKFLENYTYVLPAGDTLEIDPAIEYHDMSDLEYEWKIGGEVVSREKKLVWECDLAASAVGALCIKRVSAGNSVIYKFNVQLYQSYDRGYVVVSAGADDKVKYSFFKETATGIGEYKYDQFPYALETETAVSDWVTCKEFWSMEASPIDNPVYGHMLHMEKSPAKSYSIEGISMSIGTALPLASEFIGDAVPEGAEFTDAIYSGYVAYLSDKTGLLYMRKSAAKGYYTGKFSTLPVYYDDKELHVSYMFNAPANINNAFVFDMDNKKLLAITTSSTSFLQDGKESGKIYETGINTADVDEILYARAMSFMDDSFQTIPVLVMITKNKSGQISVSEYQMSHDAEFKLYDPKEIYSGKIIDGFGENSVVLAVDNGKTGAIFYTKESSPNTLYKVIRSSSGISSPAEFKTFESPVVSLGQGKVSRDWTTLGVGLEDGTFQAMAINTSGSEIKDSGCIWKADGRIMKVDYRYGLRSNY